MPGAIVGYIRVSSCEQNPDRQLAGHETDRVFIDRVSGATTDRPALLEMLRYVREGDTVIIHSMDRLARNLIDLRKIVADLISRKIAVKFMKENLSLSDARDPMATLLLSVMGAFAEFERELIRERQREGIAIAKTKGKYTGRKRALTIEQTEELCRRAAAGESRSALARSYGISRETLYRYINNAP